ncbi:LIM and cysteine-rich domains protein 1 isoform X1 [Dunckerocampus dactyliophorus]|uniref:LIM and cysteine-rich domains protein 1 isoform X1 n=2 Tax=Dunckerocampus dactyliophorus TaxID=161453 RepID=UPI002404B901|nr:LIM and cysteine-rich domains protein 1 isoform X1 [Dunckerocampus dactyliophorus]
MNVNAATDKMSVQSSAATPAVCLICKEGCSGLRPHSWRKACVECGCSSVDHTPGSHIDDDQQMGRLLADSPSAHLTAKVKGGGGLRLYKRNRMIVTNPVVSRKDPTFNTTTYDWAPAGLNQKLAKQYMELMPESQRPVSGTGGALQRRRQLLSQLPAYDQDPMKCQSLASDEEIASMLLFVKHYKTEVLGVGEVALPAEGGALREAAMQRSMKEAKDAVEHQSLSPIENSTTSADGPTNSADDSTKNQYHCTGCQSEVATDSPAVFAERAGYHGARWHPTCFMCSECGQGLVDLVYFWSNQRLLCGRHYCQSVWPRCSGCDELIFCKSFRTAEDGRTWHPDHYCCWRCGQSLDTPCQH